MLKLAKKDGGTLNVVRDKVIGFESVPNVVGATHRLVLEGGAEYELTKGAAEALREALEAGDLAVEIGLPYTAADAVQPTRERTRHKLWGHAYCAALQAFGPRVSSDAGGDGAAVVAVTHANRAVEEFDRKFPTGGRGGVDVRNDETA